MPLRKVLVGLIVLSTVAFAVGVILERSSEEPAAEGSGTAAPAHQEGGGGTLEGSGDEASGEAGPVLEGSNEEPSGEGAVGGIDPESTPLVVFAIVASLLIAAGCWFRPDWRLLLLVTAYVMAAFAVLDLRELIHQLEESNTGLAVVAGAVAILHAAAAATAVMVPAGSARCRLQPRPERRSSSARREPSVYSPR